MRLTVEFGGGLEGLVVGHQKEISLQLDENVLFCRDVIRHIGETWISERKDLFYSPGTLCNVCTKSTMTTLFLFLIRSFAVEARCFGFN